MILCLHVLLHVGGYGENSFVLHCWGILKILCHIMNATILLFSCKVACCFMNIAREAPVSYRTF